MTCNLYALLVGIDKYPNDGDKLNGCVNDIEAVEKFIENRLNYNPHIEKLLDKQATRQAVINKFENHLCQAGKDDVVLLYFCGHGSQEQAGLEFDALEYEKEVGKKKLETIVCYDSRTKGEDGAEIRDLADKELRYLIAKVAKNEPHILIVFDCCHSSSGTRDTDRKERVRRLPTDTRPPRAYDEFCFARDSVIVQNLKQGIFPEGKHVFMSACLHTETAKEIDDEDGKGRGVFSYFLLRELNSLNAALSYHDLLNEVKGHVHGRRRDQTPQLEPIGMSSQDLNSIAFLGDREVIRPREPYFDLIYRHEIQDRQSAEWIVTGGVSQFLQEGSELAVYPENCTLDEMKDQSRKLGDVRITAVRMEESAVTFISEAELPTNSSYKAVLTKRPLPTVRFYLEGDAAALAQVEEKLVNSLVVGIERDRSKPHQYRLYAREQRFEITDADDRLLVVPIEGNGEYDVNKAVKQVEHIARWTKTQQLENPNSSIPKDAIEIEITHNGKVYTNSDLNIKHGSTIRLKLKNTLDQQLDQPLYCAILDVADDYSVGILKVLPEGGDGTWICLNPGQVYPARMHSGTSVIEEIPFGMPKEVINQGLTEYQEVLKLIVSTEAFTTLSQFEQNSLLLPDQKSRQPLTAPPVADWMTKQITLTTVRADSVELTPQTEKEFSPGVRIMTPPGLQATARLKPPSSTTRSVSSIALPALLDNTEAFQFSTSRSVRQNASVLELEVNPSTLDAVKPDSPMIISVDRPLQPKERVLVVAHDGQFYFPLGVGQAKNGKTEIKIERLCHPQRLNTDERELRQAIQLCFRKVVLDNVGQKSSYTWLRKATVNGDGTVSYTKKGDVDTVKAAVAKANNIVLYIHGIIGDTESMIPSVRYAKVNANEQVKSLEELYDLVLAFDYESLNTSIEDTARELKRQLAAVGLEPKHGKTLHILAHSMGGLVSRSFIEQGNGNEVVSHLIMVGTPNGGSPWATVHDLATTLLSFGLNLSSVPIVPSLLEKLVEAMSVTLREMHSTKSSFLDELKTFADPRCPYSIIAGSTALMDRASEVKQLLDALKKKMRRAIELPFGQEENDIAVAVTSIIDVPKDRSPAVYIPAPIACDHLSYFRQTEGLHAIASVVGRAFGYPPDPLPPTRPSAPQGPQPNPVSPSPSSDTGTQSMRSTKGRPTEPTSNPNSSGDGNGSVNANASASTSGAVDTNESVPLQPRHSETVIASEPQVISPPSPQTEPIPSQEASPTPTQPQPNHETRTTTWFTKSHIIAIGIDKYNSDIEPLDNAVSDAKKIAGIFETQGFEKHLLLGEKDKPHLVNRDEVRKLLTNLKNTVGENDRLIFYYAGHGIALPSQDSSEPEANSQSSTNGKPETKPRNKPQGYLILQEAEQNKPETYLPMDDLIQWLSAISCRHYLMILDCCYAGAIQWSFGRTRQVLLPKVFPSLLDTFIDSPAWQILTSSDEDQPANDGLILDLSLQKNNRVSQDQTSSNSPFVCFLEQALVEGKAQIPESQIVTTTELSSYLLRMVGPSTSQAGKRQTPRLFTLPEKHKRGEFVFLLDTFEKVKKHLEDKFPDPKIDDEHNPYRGLQSYTDKEEDSNVFFGRERLIEKLSDYVHTHPLTVVLGTSGVGKSSLVNAGLVPKLKGNSEKTEQSQSLNSEEKTTQQPDSEPKAPPVKWENAIFRPGQSPAKALEEALKKLETTNIPDDTKRLLVIDQFEEVETQCRDEEQKKKFWNQLIAQLNNTSNKLHFVVTLRSDFESTLRSKFEYAIKKFGTENDKSKIKGHSKVESTNLPKSTNEQFKFPINWVSARFIVPAMEREELQDVIEKPAEEKAVFFTLEQKLKDGTERTLVQQLVNEVAGMPGALPLLSFALYTMYRNFAQRYVDAEKAGDLIKREITWEDYNSLGDDGVLGSLTRRADEEYKNLEYKLDKVEENDKSLLKVVKDEQGKAIQEEASIKKARQEMLKWVMLRMVTLDDGQVARRRVLKKELKYDERYNCTKSEQLDLVIEFFDQARLLVQGNVEVFNEKVEGGQITEEVEEKEYVEPAHDALILNWEKLREWIKEDKGNIILRDRIIPDINDWQRLREAEKPSNWKQHLLNLPGTGVDRLVEQLRVKGELKRLNKQENAGQKQSFTASKNGHSSDENTKATAQETAEIASENLPSNQAKAEKAPPQTHSDNTQPLKSSDRLWDKESRLEVLGQQLGKLRTSKESWLNKTEADFVLQSLIKRERGKARRNTFLGLFVLVLLVLISLALRGHRNALIRQAQASRESAEANLRANRQLTAAIDILQAERTLTSGWNRLNPYFWLPQRDQQELEDRIKATLYKVLYSTKERNQVQMDRGNVYEVAFNPIKDLLVTVGDGDIVRLWDSKTGTQLVPHSTGQQQVYSVSFNQDGTQLTIGGVNGVIKFWKLNSDNSIVPSDIQPITLSEELTRKQTTGTKVVDDVVRHVEFSGDSKAYGNRKLLATIANNSLKIWQLDEKAKKYTELKIQPELLSQEKVYWDAAFNPRKPQLAMITDNSKIKLWKLQLDKDKDKNLKLSEPIEINTEQKQVYSVAFNSTGDQLATSGADGTVKWWKIVEKDKTITLTEDSDSKIQTESKNVYSIAVDRNNNLASVGDDNIVRLQNSPVTIQPQLGNFFDGVPRSVAISSDSKRLATVGGANLIRLWNTDGDPIRRFEPTDERIRNIVFGLDGKLLATVGKEDLNSPKYVLRLWSSESGKQFDAISTNKEILSLAFVPGKNFLAVIKADKTVDFLSVDSHEKKFKLDENGSPQFKRDEDILKRFGISKETKIKSLVFSSGKVAVITDDYKVILGLSANKQSCILKDTENDQVTSVAFSPDGHQLATAQSPSQVRLWNLPPNLSCPQAKQTQPPNPSTQISKLELGTSKLDLLTQQSSVLSLLFNPTAPTQLITGGENGTLKFWDLSSNAPIRFPMRVGNQIKITASSANGTRLATIDDQGLHLWDIKDNLPKLNNVSNTSWQQIQEQLTQKQVNEKLGDQSLALISDMVLSSSGKYLALVANNQVLLWDTTENTPRLLGATDPSTIQSVAFSSTDAEHLITLQADALKRWTVEEGQLKGDELKLIEPDPQDNSKQKQVTLKNVKSVSFRKINTLFKSKVRLATLEVEGENPNKNNGIVRLWEASDEQMTEFKFLNQFKTDQPGSKLVVLSPDGERVATGAVNIGGAKSTVRVWDKSGNRLNHFITKFHDIEQVAFSHNSKFLAIVAKANEQNERDKESTDSNFMLVDIQSGDNLHPITQSERVSTAMFTPDDLHLATLATDQLSLWQTGDLPNLKEQVCHLVNNYLKYNPNVQVENKTLCDDVLPKAERFSSGETPTPSSNNGQDTPSSSAPSNTPAPPQNVPSPTPTSNNGNALSPTPSSNNEQDTPSSSAPSKIQAHPRNVPSPTPTSNNGQHSYEQARSDRRQASKLNSTSVDGYINQGLTYHRQRNYQQAIRSYSKALDLNPKSAKAYSNRAAAYNEQKEYQKAIDDSDKAIGLIPTYINAYINRGLAYYHQGKYQQAIADYTEAIELDPNNANAYHNRALAYTRLGNQQAAQANQRKAAALSQRQLR